MANGTILKPASFSVVERITSFPFTPTSSGIASLLVTRNDGNTGWVDRQVKVKENGVSRFDFDCIFYHPWSGVTVFFPVIAGKTYTFADGASYVQFIDDRSALVY